MKVPEDKLTRPQERALAALLRSPTVAQAAAAAKVSERALYYWLRQDAFLAAYRTARRQAVEAAVAQIQQAAAKAVETLVAELDGERSQDRIRAAVALLDRATAGVELVDLAARLEELERVQRFRKAV